MVGKICNFYPIQCWQSPLVSTSKTLYIFSRRLCGILWRLILFYGAFFETVAKSRTDEVYGLLVYDSAALLRVSFCVSWAFLVIIVITVT